MDILELKNMIAKIKTQCSMGEFNSMPSCFICVWLFETLWTVSRQAPLSMGFSRQEYWSGSPCPPAGDLPDPGMEPVSLMYPALAGSFFFFFKGQIILFYFLFFCSEFCHTLKWNSHGFTCVPHPDPPSHLPLHPLPLGLPSAPGTTWEVHRRMAKRN